MTVTIYLCWCRKLHISRGCLETGFPPDSHSELNRQDALVDYSASQKIRSDQKPVFTVPRWMQNQQTGRHDEH